MEIFRKSNEMKKFCTINKISGPDSKKIEEIRRLPLVEKLTLVAQVAEELSREKATERIYQRLASSMAPKNKEKLVLLALKHPLLAKQIDPVDAREVFEDLMFEDRASTAIKVAKVFLGPLEIQKASKKHILLTMMKDKRTFNARLKCYKRAVAELEEHPSAGSKAYFGFLAIAHEIRQHNSESLEEVCRIFGLSREDFIRFLAEKSHLLFEKHPLYVCDFLKNNGIEIDELKRKIEERKQSNNSLFYYST